MIKFTRRAVVAVAALGLVSTSLSATGVRADTTPGALADGKAEGTLTVNGKTTKVAFAYARSVPGFFDKNVNDVEVIVSDVALDAKAQADEFVRIKMADAGKLHAFEITVDAEGKPISSVWRHNGFKGPAPSGLSTADVFTKNVLDGKVVDGGYKSATEAEFFGNTYAFDVTFRANIGH
ncbi:MAG: hypothetical protein ABSC22_11360 [Roseiarcus sp.]|jgi:hypothetical protein